MTTYYNELNQPVGFPMPEWKPCQPPPRVPLIGRLCRVVPLDPAQHARQLYEANSTATDDGDWTYLPYDPYADFEPYLAWVQSIYQLDDPVFYAIVDQTTDRALGVASLMRIVPSLGVIEVGHIHFSRLMQKTPMATEAMYLMMRHIFEDLGYRRYEWKCDALNMPSRGAAQRLGFQYEGTFRQHRMYKGRSRDTAWFSILDTEWPRIKVAFERWLSAENFDAQNQQRTKLSI